MIKFDNVSKIYPSHEALIDVEFHLQRGEMAFLTGHSGAGKSTLLKLITLIERPSHGRIFLAGQEVTTLADYRIPYLRRQMGIVFQNPRLLEDRTVFNNVALPLVILGVPHRELGRRVRGALAKVGLLHKEDVYPKTLSCGEQQRINIARAIVHKPLLLLADEPTGNLDPALSLEIIQLFEEFNQVGVSVLIASHDVNLISSLPYRCLKLNQGRLYEQSSQAYAEHAEISKTADTAETEPA
jgi:cell division transport system ATP-binding protein